MMSSVCVGSCGRLKASNIQFKIIEAIGATSKIRYRYTHEEAIVDDDYLRAHAESIPEFMFHGEQKPEVTFI
jgi:hypothetical protein